MAAAAAAAAAAVDSFRRALYSVNSALSSDISIAHSENHAAVAAARLLFRS